MTDATISRVRMRELVRRGRSRPEAANSWLQPSQGYGSSVFTGIVRDVGRVVSFDGSRLVVETSVAGEVGDSIAIDGICLTVVASGDHQVTFEVVPETLGRVKPFGGEVNVEPPLRAGDPLGGHYVQGHVDAVGRVTSVEAEGDGLRVFVDAPDEVLQYCVEKGSIAVDGISLTVAEVADGGFAIALVPHTLASTTFSTLVPGRAVNLEVDVLAKYVERLLKPRAE
jgi:riboflavin synthase